ncbi:unnamed protein product, partial [marine sediment metagenome]
MCDIDNLVYCSKESLPLIPHVYRPDRVVFPDDFAQLNKFFAFEMGFWD